MKIKEIIFILLVSFLLLILIFVISSEHKPNHSIQVQHIYGYLEGDSLLMERLMSIQNEWKKQKPKIEKKGGGFATRIFGGLDDDQILDSTAYLNWKSTLNSIDDAIDYRRLIDQMDFDVLRRIVFRNRNYIENSINNIPKPLYEKVKVRIGDVSNCTLIQISDSINNIVKQLKEEQINIENNVVTSNQKTLAEQNSHNNSKKNPASDQYEKKQEEWENQFWKLIHKGDLSKMDFDHWYIKGSNIPSSNPYKKFYNEYLHSQNKYERFIRNMDRLPLSKKTKFRTLNELIKQLR